VRRPLVLGNWKMNGDMVSNEQLLGGLLDLSEPLLERARVDVGLAVPSPYLFQVAIRLRGRGVHWGAQDVSDQPSGAFTGEISVLMLQDFECTFSLVGHSERRARQAESDDSVNRKTKALQAKGLMPVVCVGESLEQRQSGRATDAVCAQVRAALVGLDAERVVDVAIAYEPIWAIGSGLAARPEDAQAMHLSIREALRAAGLPSDRLRILYGGSVRAADAAVLLAQPDIDGVLVGGASLDAVEFSGILQAAVARVH